MKKPNTIKGKEAIKKWNSLADIYGEQIEANPFVLMLIERYCTLAQVWADARDEYEGHHQTTYGGNNGILTVHPTIHAINQTSKEMRSVEKQLLEVLTTKQKKDTLEL